MVTPYWNDLRISELVDFAVNAEELGYDSLWIPEMWGRDAFSLLTLLASHTKTIKLATGVVSVFSRTPAAIASAIATIDEISEGRVVLGLGTSGAAVIENWHGLKFEKALRRTEEYVDIIRLILSGARADYEGEIFSLKNFRLQFKPVRDSVPIYIAAIGPKNIALTGRLADGWIPFLIPHQSLAESKTALLASAQMHGRNPGDITVAPYLPACISSDADAARATVKEYIAYYVGGMGDYYYNIVSRSGFAREAEAISQSWRKADKAGAINAVSDALLSAVSITGTEKEGTRAMDAYRKAGADLPILIFPPKSAREMVEETVAAMAPGKT